MVVVEDQCALSPQKACLQAWPIGSLYGFFAFKFQPHLATSDEETRTLSPKTFLAACPGDAELCHREYGRLVTAKSISIRFFGHRIVGALSTCQFLL